MYCNTSNIPLVEFLATYASAEWLQCSGHPLEGLAGPPPVVLERDSLRLVRVRALTLVLSRVFAGAREGHV